MPIVMSYIVHSHNSFRNLMVNEDKFLIHELKATIVMPQVQLIHPIQTSLYFIPARTNTYV